MGKSKKRGKSNIDWDALVRAEPAGDAGGWHTGPAAMALDDGEEGGGSGGAPAAVAEVTMGEAVGAALAGQKQREPRGGGRGAGCGGGGAAGCGRRRRGDKLAAARRPTLSPAPARC
jgi:hypothetical protein